MARRLRVPLGPEETIRTARVLASARAFLAVSSLIAIYLDPTEPTSYVMLAYGLMVFYAVYSIVVLVVMRLRHTVPGSASVMLHIVDLLWAVVMTLFTEGPNSPFYLFFNFVLLAAAYRWGFRETILTAVAIDALMFGEAALLLQGELLEGTFQVHRLIMRATYLLLMGFLLGFLAEEDKRLRGEGLLLGRILSRIQAERGLRPALIAILSEIHNLFGARQVVLVTRELFSGRAFRWDTADPDGSPAEALHFSELNTEESARYFLAAPGACWLASRDSQSDSPWNVAPVDESGRRLPSVAHDVPPAVARGASSVIGAQVAFGHEWGGRLYVLDPEIYVGVGDLRFLSNLVRQVGPAVYSVYLFRRLRARAGAMERARVARELHDGIIQSLVSLELQLDAVRAKPDSPQVSGELSRIQGLLHQSILEVRELMQQMKPVDVDPKRFLDYLADIVDRFRRDTGIGARFVSELDEVILAPRACRELARIVQEALVNVRKHSGASHVLVRFSSRNGNWLLEIQDDGRGFEFSGVISSPALFSSGHGPLVIKERVRAIGGELTIESTPGRGARLDITIPRKAYD